MSRNLNHLLLKHGILTSLSVARKLNDADTHAMTERVRAIAKNKVDFNNKLRSEIEKETTSLIMNGRIPGVILNSKTEPDIMPENTHIPKEDKPKRKVYNVDKERLSLLYAIAAMFNKEALTNKLSKNDICFTIYTILNFLEISQDDFKKFHDELDNPNNENE
jgi:hypothetical protein